MKVDADLRHAIQAAAKTGKNNSHQIRVEHDRRRKEAVKTFLASNTRNASKALKADHQIKVFEAKLQEARNTLDSLGLRYDYKGEFDIQDDDAFTKAGGVLPLATEGVFTAEEVIAALAAAPSKDRPAILKRFGINWED